MVILNKTIKHATRFAYKNKGTKFNENTSLLCAFAGVYFFNIYLLGAGTALPGAGFAPGLPGVLGGATIIGFGFSQ